MWTYTFEIKSVWHSSISCSIVYFCSNRVQVDALKTSFGKNSNRGAQRERTPYRGKLLGVIVLHCDNNHDNRGFNWCNATNHSNLKKLSKCTVVHKLLIHPLLRLLVCFGTFLSDWQVNCLKLWLYLLWIRFIWPLLQFLRKTSNGTKLSL